MSENDVQHILEIGVMLSSERDIRKLLNRVLCSVMEISRCDAGTLYLREGDTLKFKVSRNNTLKNFSGGDEDPDLPPVPLTRESVCALSLLENKTILADDVYNNAQYDFTGPIKYDAIIGYHTQSMLVTPMRNRKGEIIGVLQLINAMDKDGAVCPFSSDMVLLVESVASQAAVAIQNVRYTDEIRDLFQSFVRVMSSAIDERTPYNASHSRRMAQCGAAFSAYLEDSDYPHRFSPEEKDELVMSIWLHDIGKLVTPLEVMNKSARLLPEQKTALLHRMEVIRLRAQIDCLSSRCSREELDAVMADTVAAQQLVERIDRAGYVADELLEQLGALAQRTYTDEDGKRRPWLTDGEAQMLSIRKGTLSAEERAVMEGHVEITEKLLSQINFSPELSHVRQWAAAHHELLNGSGYPRHLQGDEIPWQVRIITILDVFDALVADDRPYKPAMPVERALSILTDMAQKEGRLDPVLTRLFIQSRCWEGVL